MNDLVERLHTYLASELDTSDDAARERDAMIAEAADEIERLRAQLVSDIRAETEIDRLETEIKRLRAENKMLQLKLTEAARHMHAQDEELKRLRALEFELRSDIALAPLSPTGKRYD